MPVGVSLPELKHERHITVVGLRRTYDGHQNPQFGDGSADAGMVRPDPSEGLARPGARLCG